MPKYYDEIEQLRPISIEEIERYINEMPDEDSKVFLALCWLSGSRVNEIVKLQKNQVFINNKLRDMSLNYIALKHGKRAQPSFSFRDPFIETLVLPYFEKINVGYGDSTERIFMRGKRYYQKQLLKANKKLYGNDTKKFIIFHHLRHSRITYLAQALRATQEEMKAWTGHKTGTWMDYIAARKVDRFKGKIR